MQRCCKFESSLCVCLFHASVKFDHGETDSGRARWGTLSSIVSSQFFCQKSVATKPSIRFVVCVSCCFASKFCIGITIISSCLETRRRQRRTRRQSPQLGPQIHQCHVKSRRGRIVSECARKPKRSITASFNHFDFFIFKLFRAKNPAHKNKARPEGKRRYGTQVREGQET